MLSLSDSIFPALQKNFSWILTDMFSPSFLTFVKKCYTTIRCSNKKKYQ